MTTTLIYLAIGLAAGLLSGIFGIGGGILIVPALLLFGGMTPKQATGTSLTALILPVGALAAWRYYRAGHVNVTAGFLLALGLFAGAWFGAGIGESLDPVVAKRLFAVFLAMVSVRVWLSA